MRLNQIKLSGFKSFGEPTTFALPGQRVGVVGPNGCGKSNIMDAVRWVLGESKASELRGESMQDVIFNGSGLRKPAGRASVELVFDNSDARAGGPVEPVRRDRRQARADARRHAPATTSTTSRCAAATCRTCSSAPASARAPTPSSARARSAASSRSQARGAAPVPRRSRRRLQVQGAPPRDREPAEGHAREPDARRRHPARAQRQPRQAGEAGRGGAAVPRAAGTGHAEAAPALVPQAPRRGRRRAARASARCWKPPTRWKRAWPSCAMSRPSWKRCARRTTPAATRCTSARASWPRPRSK